MVKERVGAARRQIKGVVTQWWGRTFGDCHKVKVRVKDTAGQKETFVQAWVLCTCHQDLKMYRT